LGRIDNRIKAKGVPNYRLFRLFSPQRLSILISADETKRAAQPKSPTVSVHHHGSNPQIFAIANPPRLCSLICPMANPTNVLSSGIEITGSIRFSNDMIIDGKIDGEITSDKGRVTIGENAVIKGDVTAGEVKVYGKVEGKITSQRCELKDKSKINGDIKSKVFSMEEGAQLSGRTDIGG
jgi:cytoskeletal protein CcmA (bactofilin family)